MEEESSDASGEEAEEEEKEGQKISAQAAKVVGSKGFKEKVAGADFQVLGSPSPATGAPTISAEGELLNKRLGVLPALTAEEIGKLHPPPTRGKVKTADVLLAEVRSDSGAGNAAKLQNRLDSLEACLKSMEHVGTKDVKESLAAQIASTKSRLAEATKNAPKASKARACLAGAAEA